MRPLGPVRGPSGRACAQGIAASHARLAAVTTYCRVLRQHAGSAAPRCGLTVQDGRGRRNRHGVNRAEVARGASVVGAIAVGVAIVVAVASGGAGDGRRVGSDATADRPVHHGPAAPPISLGGPGVFARRRNAPPAEMPCTTTASRRTALRTAAHVTRSSHPYSRTSRAGLRSTASTSGSQRAPRTCPPSRQDSASTASQSRATVRGSWALTMRAGLA